MGVAIVVTVGAGIAARASFAGYGFRQTFAAGLVLLVGTVALALVP